MYAPTWKRAREEKKGGGEQMQVGSLITKLVGGEERQAGERRAERKQMGREEADGQQTGRDNSPTTYSAG